MNFLTIPNQPVWVKPVLIWVGIIVGTNILCMGVAVGIAFGYDRAYQNRIFAGISADGVRFDGLTREQAASVLQHAVDNALNQSMVFQVGERQIRLSTATVPTEDPDVSHDYIRYDVGRTVDQAFALGRTGSDWTNALTRLRLRLSPINLPVQSAIDRSALRDALNAEVKDLITDPKNAVLNITVPVLNKPLAVNVEAERVGHDIDVEKAIDALETQAQQLNFQRITLDEAFQQPEIKEADIQKLIPEIPALLAHAPFKVTAEDHVWTITSSTLATWINVATGTSRIALAIDPERMNASLNPLIGTFLRGAQDGKLTLEDGKLKEFVAPVEGVGLDTNATIWAIYTGWENGSSTIPLVLERKVPKILGEDAERMGIRESLGVGRSNFSGSPKNRRFNIALGAKKVNGSIIAPDEEFSLLKTLGKVDGVNGWLPELVIKDNKTTPEFGGGLCQIGTTVFRTTLSSGLPITERRNHSYRVRYYEPAGTDATIYEPSPDYKFKNDTGHWILATTLNTGNDLIFTFWGTRDGRTVEQTRSRVYNITPPPEKKIVETLDLEPGKTKCTETAHAGADASFDYTVTYPNGEVKKVTFSSHYRPWGAVCLVGVAALTAPVAPVPVDETGINNPN